MRLTCPNCGAQYEVPPDAIPTTGREVQCSACQRVWFEQGASGAPSPVYEPDLIDSVPRVEDDQEEADDMAEVAITPPPQAPPRPRIDPEVSRILREEAERERATRVPAEAPDESAAPAAAPELMPEFSRHAEFATSTVATALAPRSQGSAAPPSSTAPLVARPPSRPARAVVGEVDPDRISSTLRSPPNYPSRLAPHRDPEPPEQRSGFGRGFVWMLILLAVLAGIYLFRPEITAAVPAAAVVLDPYAEAVDTGRAWLYGLRDRIAGPAPATPATPD